ncbi:MAG: chorismate synthase [Alphaproteobacteria bacterium]|nr:chorismate synthase [Alphaproteobacteria bacterium]
MASNSFGSFFRFTSFGESHGPFIGVVVDGCPPRLPFTEADVQPFLDQRKPGQSAFTTARQEDDRVEILSGTYEGVTTGAPVCMLVVNKDQRPGDYDSIKHSFRPGHADYTYSVKYGVRDPRGGGRSSARETIARVAAGALARKVLGEKVQIRGAVVQLGPHKIDRAKWDWQETQRNPFFAPDATAALLWAQYLEAVKKEGNAVGAVVELHASGLEAGWGDPVYEKLDSALACAMMSINAVKGVEIGSGFALAAMTSDQGQDEMRRGEDGRPVFLSNHAGGVLGGISTGQDVVVRFALKPTSSILMPRRTVNEAGEEIMIETQGRHDPCVGIRAVPIGEAMLACVLADAKLKAKALL